jgi:tetratricopeptide (TPR) repeat protein
MAHNAEPHADLRLWTFRALLVVFPLALFFILEVALRLSGLVKTYPLFVAYPGRPDLLETNPDVVKRYFSPAIKIPSLARTTVFTKKKRFDALRIVIQGSSTAFGFPYCQGALLPGMIRQRLQQQYPDRHVEVIQTALEAVNSFALVDFADEILSIKPDAVFIYAGHNEFLGIMGVNGVGAHFAGSKRIANLLYLQLSKLCMFQAMRQMVYSFTPKPDAATPTDTTRSLLASIAQKSRIAYGSKLYTEGLRQFEGNLDLLIHKYQKAGIPVYLGTLVCNLRDLPPFASSDHDSSELPPLVKTATRSLDLDNRDSTARCIELLQQHFAGKTHALAAFRLAQLLWQQARYLEAADWFNRARDWDVLRFRAPSAFNSIVRRLAQKYRNCYLVDVESDFIKHSEHRIIGSPLILEHVHPNIDGYFLLSSAFFTSFLKNSHIQPQKPGCSIEEARRNIPVLKAEIYSGQATVERLIAGFPFCKQPRPVRVVPVNDWQDLLGLEMTQGSISWVEMACASLAGFMQRNDTASAATAAALVADATPQDLQVNYMAGNLLMHAGRPAEAVPILEGALVLASRNVNVLFSLSNAHALVGHSEKARLLLDQVLQIDPGNSTALAAKHQLEFSP